MKKNKSQRGKKLSRKQKKKNYMPSQDQGHSNLSHSQYSNVSLSHNSNSHGQTDKPKKQYIDHKTVEIYKNRIYSFLISNNYPSKIEKTQLKVPSKGLFKDILIFLLNKLDERIESFEYEDEDFINIINQLGYPTPLNPNTLKNFNSPSSWNQLLSLLCYFIDQVRLKYRIMYNSQILLKINEVKQESEEKTFYTNCIRDKVPKAEMYKRFEDKTTEYIKKAKKQYEFSLINKSNLELEIKKEEADKDDIEQLERELHENIESKLCFV